MTASNAFDPIVAAAAVVKEAALKAFGAEIADVDAAVRRSDRADLQADLAMGLARRLKKAPALIAKAIAEAIATDGVIEKAEVAGPGFINLTLSGVWLGRAASALLSDEAHRLGLRLVATPDRIVIDYSGPNVAKEMHVGHLRSTVIGDALLRVLKARGHTVIPQNHLGDWGTPFGMLIEHLVDLGGLGAGEVAVRELTRFYREARKKFDEEPAFADRSRGRVVLLQSGDADTLAMWRALVDVSKRYFHEVYDKLSVSLKPDDIAGESFYNARLGPLADELESTGKATVNDGALCYFPAGFSNKEGAPLPLIVRKKDGGFGYATTDLAAIRYRLNELEATRIVYVIGAPQQQHLAMFFQAAKELGWLASPARAEHVAFGSVLGTDKKMFASRSGETFRLIDLVDSAIAKAEAVIREKLSNVEPALVAELAPMIGIGAIKYADLSSDRIKDYVFDLERMIAFDGNSAGYAQYAHARTRSVLRKAKEANAVVGPIGAPVEPAERALLLQLLGLGAVLAKVDTTLEPHHIAGYVYEVAMCFATFWEKCPVLAAEPELRSSRLGIVRLTGETIAYALGLLGIAAPDRM